MLRGEDDITRFANSARPGDRETYGRGERPDRELVRAMQPYVEAGVLSPTSKREDGGFLFMVERTRRPLIAKRRRLRRRKTATGMVFDCLVRAARNAAPCPSLDEIGARCGLSKLSARYHFDLLARRGRISAAPGGPFNRRVVTILQGPHSGRRTMTIEEPPAQTTLGDPGG